MTPNPAAKADLSPEDRYRAPALDKGLDILELLSEQPQVLTRAEIVKAMGRSPSEIYRMLERLVARHYVARSPEGDRSPRSPRLCRPSGSPWPGGCVRGTSLLAPRPAVPEGS